jgi:CBS-domain-containing membrane protein
MTSEYRAGSPAVGRNFIDMTVGEIMEKKVQSAHPDTGADVVASLIVEGFGSLPIVDEQQRLIGVVSEHDLLTVLDGGRRWSDLKAQDVMSRNPYSVRMETTVATLSCAEVKRFDPCAGRGRAESLDRHRRAAGCGACLPE